MQGSYPDEKTINTTNSKNKEKLYNIKAGLKTELAGGLTNRLDATFNKYNQNFNTNYATSPIVEYYAPTIYNTTSQKEDNYIFYLRDDITYSKKIGGFELEPSLNINFNWYKSSLSSNEDKTSSYDGNRNGVIYSTEISRSLFGRNRNITPSLRFSYLNILNIQGGVLCELPIEKIEESRSISPFVSATLSLSKLISPKATNSLSIFGSFAKEPSSIIPNQPVSDFSTDNRIPFEPSSYYFSVIEVKRLDGKQIGVSTSLFKKHLSFDYIYDDRNIIVPLVSKQYNAFGQQLIYQQGRWTNHQFRAVVDLKNASHLAWFSAFILNYFNTRESESGKYNFQDYPIISNRSLKYLSFYTAGWVNRMKYKLFSAELDVLSTFDSKHISKNVFYPSSNVFRLQNVALGYQVKSKSQNKLDFFISSKNPYYNKSTEPELKRRYIGAGVRGVF